MVSGQSTTEAAHTATDDNVQNFLHNCLDSLVKWDLIRFFHDNPHTRDTAENIASYTGRDVKKIERELRELVATKVLQVQKIAGLTIYELTADESVRAIINRFMEACHSRAFRSKAIYHVIQRMQTTQRI